MNLNDVVKFRGDRLFNGAVNIGWFDSDEIRKDSASKAFVFHGPSYHGVSQEDIGVTHGHKLQDTASFTRSLINRCYGVEEQPFTLAIAGYGTGKSHLGLTLATLLSDPKQDVAEEILEGLDKADENIAADIRATLSENKQPCLIVAVNGMQSFDLTTEVSRQILKQIKIAGLDSRPIDDLRPRFAQAGSLIKISKSNQEIVTAILEECGVENIEDILIRLDEQDEIVYSKVHKILADRSVQITALGGESIRDVIDVACREYCGKDKHFRSLVFIFDEFGRYTEFATVRSHVAGSGVLQDLFEGIQANSGRASFAGFIQFDLNAYVQRVAPEHRNEILRYVTRYQSANRVYLSINLETLIASLIDKNKPEELARRMDNNEARQESAHISANILRWFPQSKNHSLWGNEDQFHAVVRRGCWPLSAYSTWFLFHLAAAGKHLQERSALALLGDVFDRFHAHELDNNNDWALAPADFWSESLQHELILSEEGGQQGSITHAYAAVHARHGARIGNDLIRLLRAVVIASKLGLKVADQDDATEALAELAGLHLAVADEGIKQLKEEYNVLEWDESFKEFDILGDAVPRTQFLSFVRQRVASTYDESGKSRLFASKAGTWCDLLQDLDCDFSEENRVTTREWRYKGVTSSWDLLPMQIMQAANMWSQSYAVDEPRGTIIYCYVEPSLELGRVATEAKKLLKAASKEAGVVSLPILVVLLCDAEGTLGQSLAELAVLDDSINDEDRVRFGNLIPAHQEKMRSAVRNHVESMIKQRVYLTALKEPLEAKRLSRAGSELFSSIYKNVLTFPFDGFSTARGNAADSCQELTAELLQGHLDWNTVISKPAKVKNRASSVLRDEWGIFGKNGRVLTRPIHPVVRKLTESWDELLDSGDQRIQLQTAIKRLCAPPFGANIASAGLFFGVFVAARSEKICIIRDGEQSTVSQLVHDDLFKRKFLDLNALHGVDLVRLGDESSEWDTLLDEWEAEETHLAMKSCLRRAEKLEARVPVPPTLVYRYTHLKGKSATSIEALEKAAEKEDEALKKIELGLERRNLNQIAWGAALLVELVNMMRQQAHLWFERQIQDIEPSIENARQFIIQEFPNWINNQGPNSQTPDEVGTFKHRMLHLTGGNLKKLGLDDLYEKLEERVKTIVKNVEVVAEAQQSLRDVNLWLTGHKDATRFARVAELRALREVGEDYRSKLTGLARRIEMPEIAEVRAKLNDAIAEMKKAEEGLVKRAGKLWNSNFKSVDDLQKLTDEVDSLVGAFEGCPADLEDLQIMRRALRLYQKDYKDLEDDRLSWGEFESLAKTLEAEAESDLGEEEIPWPPEEVFKGFVSSISKERTQKSAEWIDLLEKESADIERLSVAEANQLHIRANSQPAILSKKHKKRLLALTNKIEARLDALKIEWLLEKFSELPSLAQKEFQEKINEILASKNRN